MTGATPTSVLPSLMGTGKDTQASMSTGCRVKYCMKSSLDPIFRGSLWSFGFFPLFLVQCIFFCNSTAQADTIPQFLHKCMQYIYIHYIYMEIHEGSLPSFFHVLRRLARVMKGGLTLLGCRGRGATSTGATGTGTVTSVGCWAFCCVALGRHTGCRSAFPQLC